MIHVGGSFLGRDGSLFISAKRSRTSRNSIPIFAARSSAHWFDRTGEGSSSSVIGTDSWSVSTLPTATPTPALAFDAPLLRHAPSVKAMRKWWQGLDRFNLRQQQQNKTNPWHSGHSTVSSSTSKSAVEGHNASFLRTTPVPWWWWWWWWRWCPQ